MREKSNLFTRRHYEALAKLVKKHGVQDTDFVRDLVDLFKTDNPKFDESRFLDAIQSKPNSYTG